jgi:UPF0755 protein
MRKIEFGIKISIVVLLPLIVALIVFVQMRQIFILPANVNDKEIVLVKVKSGRDLKEVGSELVEKGVLKWAGVLNVLKKFAVKDKTKVIMEGEYEFSPSMTPKQILNKMLNGEVTLRKVSIKAGLSIWELGEIFEEAGICSKSDFEAALGDGALLKQYNLPVESFEGYFYPKTYEFSSLDSPQRIIGVMLAEAEKHWPKENTESADRLELSRHEVLTLASIIQKEAKDPDDYGNLASALYNRSTYGMKFESDETVIYGLKDFDGNFTPEDREEEHPYNTWIIPGFPPGPICNPSDVAIDAVLTLPKTTNLFWIKNTNGKFEFVPDKKSLEDLKRSRGE